MTTHQPSSNTTAASVPESAASDAASTAELLLQRREMFATLFGAALLGGCATSGASAEPGGQPANDVGSAAASASDSASAAASPFRRLRRVVTTDSADGRGVVFADGEPTNVFEMTGTRITRLWEVDEIPAVTPFTVDRGATAGNAYRDGFRGASFYIAELPGGPLAQKIPLHRTPSMDFMAVLSGEVVLLLEDRELTIRAGDTIVQGGNLHGWENRGSETCVLLFVVLSNQRGG